MMNTIWYEKCQINGIIMKEKFSVHATSVANSNTLAILYFSTIPILLLSKSQVITLLSL